MFFFFFNDTATTEIYTLSLHDALPILRRGAVHERRLRRRCAARYAKDVRRGLTAFCRNHVSDHANRRQRRPVDDRSEEHTSELQSRQYLVCRLLLEKKKTYILVTIYMV